MKYIASCSNGKDSLAMVLKKKKKNAPLDHVVFIDTGKEFKFGLELFNEVDEYKPYEYLIKLNLPKLFVHGKADSVVPYKISEEVSKMCNNSKLELIENGEHSFKNSKDALENAVDVTVKFVKEVLK